MKTSGGLLIIRSVCVTFAVHTLFIIVAITSIYLLPWQLNALLGLQTDLSLLRVIELPVLWAVDPALRALLLIPSWPTLGAGATVAKAASEAMLFSVFGGAFYSLVAGAVALIHLGREGSRNKKMPAKEWTRSVPPSAAS